MFELKKLEIGSYYLNNEMIIIILYWYAIHSFLLCVLYHMVGFHLVSDLLTGLLGWKIWVVTVRIRAQFNTQPAEHHCGNFGRY